MTWKNRAGTHRGRRIIAAALLAGFLAACGGGGSGSDDLPATLTVSAPSGTASLGSAVAFSANASGSYSYLWSFGDGTTSTDAAPSHAFARAGVFEVTLTLRNGDGATATARIAVPVADRGIVQGQVCLGPGESGWCWQQPLPQGNLIRAYHFVDDAIAYAVGVHGQILKSIDGGSRWHGQTSGTPGELGTVAFVDARVGWAGGTFGEVLRTVDGGDTWERMSIGRSESISAIGAADADRAWVVTIFGSILVTHDGGRRWTALALPEAAVRVAPLSDMDFWLLPYGFGSASPSALHTVDGGASWTRVWLPSLAAGLASDPRGLQFVDAQHGLYVRNEYGYDAGGAWVYRLQAFVTADGGATWQPLAPPPGADSGSRYILAGPSAVYWTQPYLNPARTTDGGATWREISLPAGWTSIYDPQLRSLGGNRLLVSDYAAATFLSFDGGATWTSRGAGGPAQVAGFNSIWFFDSREGVAWADDGSSSRTADGGQTWTTTAPVQAYGWRRGQFAADGTVGWIVSDTGTIYRSTDKGRSWFAPAPQIATPMYGVQDLHFVDALHGWAISPYGSAGGSAIWTSADGGLTWQLPPGLNLPSGFVSVRFADATHGVAVGPPGFALVSSDAGLTWTARPTGAYGLSRITFADANVAVAIGDQGTIVRSADRGQTWTLVQGPGAGSLFDVRFVSATVGHAVGDQGAILVTRDGGVTWNRQEPGVAQHLRAVFFVDEMSGWVSGLAGTILATATGGR